VGRLAQLTGERLVRALLKLGWTVKRRSVSQAAIWCWVVKDRALSPFPSIAARP
jgi:hypothetical protein